MGSFRPSVSRFLAENRSRSVRNQADIDDEVNWVLRTSFRHIIKLPFHGGDVIIKVGPDVPMESVQNWEIMFKGGDCLEQVWQRGTHPAMELVYRAASSLGCQAASRAQLARQCGHGPGNVRARQQVIRDKPGSVERAWQCCSKPDNELVGQAVAR